MATNLVLILMFLAEIKGQNSNLPDCPPTIGVHFLSQPRDNTVCVGSQAKMACTYTGIETTPLWLINETAYISNRLPPHHKYDGRVLILTSTFLEENNTTYQCFFELFHNGSFCLHKSTVGKLTVITNDICEQRPENITRMVGEMDVFIPCTVSGYNPQIWEINGSIYELFQLPQVFVPIYGGIVIKVVQRNLNGLSFRCYTNIGFGYIVEASPTGYLTVTSRGGSVNFGVDSSDLYIDHQTTHFDKNVTLSWKPVADPQCNEFEVISRNTCGEESLIQNTWHSKQLLSLSIPASSFHIKRSGVNEERADILIKANNDNGFVCNSAKATMQVQNSVITRKLYSSFSKSKAYTFFTLKNSTFNLVIPQSGTIEDCFCPIFFYRASTCYNIRGCSCLGDTVFGNSVIEFCNLSEDNSISIKIQNLTREMNGVRLSIFHGYFCEHNVKFIPPYRIYTNSFEIAIVLPEPPVVTIVNNNENIEICIMPYGENVNSPDMYSVVTYDITGESFFQSSFVPDISSSICISIHTVTQEHLSECAPLLASVSAVNMFGQVETITSINSESTTGDICSCILLNETVTLLTKFEANIDSNILNIKCYQTKYISDFEVEVVINGELKQNISCNINSEKSLSYNELSCGRDYNVSFYWKPSNTSLDVQCLLHHTKVFPKCWPWIVPIIIIVAVIIIAAIIIMVISCHRHYCFRKCTFKRNVQPITDNYTSVSEVNKNHSNEHSDQNIHCNCLRQCIRTIWSIVLWTKNYIRRKNSSDSDANDLGPDKMAICDAISDIFKRHGAVALKTPFLEIEDTTKQKYESEHLRLYHLYAHGLYFSLRYDLTVPFARYIAKMEKKNELKMKRYQIDGVYRHDQRLTKAIGNTWEFYQCDFDIAGKYEPMIPDAECLKVITEVLSELEFEMNNVTIKVSHCGIMKKIIKCGCLESEFKEICSQVDKNKKWIDVCKTILHDSPAKIRELENYMKPYPSLYDLDESDLKSIAPEEVDEMKTLSQYCEAFGINVKVCFEPNLPFRLGYYTGIVFEVVLTDIDENETDGKLLAAGGRYDDMVNKIEPDYNVPCVGFTIYIEEIFTLLSKRKIRTIQTMVLVASEQNCLIKGIKLCTELWKSKIKAEFYYIKENPTLEEQLDYCKENDIPYCIIINDNGMFFRKAPYDEHRIENAAVTDDSEALLGGDEVTGSDDMGISLKELKELIKEREKTMTLFKKQEE